MRAEAPVGRLAGSPAPCICWALCFTLGSSQHCFGMREFT
jgi:hypothetical protein